MNDTISIFAKVTNGIASNQKLYLESLQQFDGDVEIIIRKRKSIRSLSQNNFLHLLLTIFSKELISYTGDKRYTMSMVKDIVKGKFLLVEEHDDLTDTTYPRIRHTSELNKAEFSNLIEEIYQYAAEKFQIVLPTANSQGELNI